MTGHFTLSRLVIGSAIAIAGIGGVRGYMRLSQVDRSRIITIDDNIPQNFKRSRTMTSNVNPKGFPLSVMDTRQIQLKIKSHRLQVSDEELLAYFVRGFFGGMVFTPERILANSLLRLLPSITYFGSLDAIQPPEQATCKDDFPRDKLLPLHSRICDLFQVTEVHVAEGLSASSGTSESYIDFAFGSDSSTFAGAHRFSVTRQTGLPGEVTMSFASFVCNPQTGKNPIPAGGDFFHRVYAILLFRDAMAEVQNELQ